MRVNIKGGTPQHGTESLCKTCSNYRYRKGDTENSEQIYCSSFKGAPPLAFVKECNQYSDKKQLNLWEMEKIAYVLLVKKDKVVGFQRYNEWVKENPEEDLLPGY